MVIILQITPRDLIPRIVTWFRQELLHLFKLTLKVNFVFNNLLLTCFYFSSSKVLRGKKLPSIFSLDFSRFICLYPKGRLLYSIHRRCKWSFPLRATFLNDRFGVLFKFVIKTSTCDLKVLWCRFCIADQVLHVSRIAKVLGKTGSCLAAYCVN